MLAGYIKMTVERTYKYNNINVLRILIFELGYVMELWRNTHTASQIKKIYTKYE